MMRILGIVCGAAIAVALLTWLVGVPQFTSQRPTDNGEPFAVVELPPPEPEPADSPSVDVRPPQDATPAAAAAPAAATPPSSAEEPETIVDLLPPGNAAADTVPAAMQPEPANLPEQWYAFWSPFRSEIAANGFVTELQRVTGLDYRVVKVKPGVYEVAFSYADEDSLEQYLSTISAATGLDLPGSP